MNNAGHLHGHIKKGNRKMKNAFMLAATALCALMAVAEPGLNPSTSGVKPPKRETLIHSHNDYAQKRPFWGAYEAGADSIEADIYLADGDLLVAHDRNKVKASATLSLILAKRWRLRPK